MATLGTTSDSGQARICMKLVFSSHNPSGQACTAMDESNREDMFSSQILNLVTILQLK